MYCNVVALVEKLLKRLRELGEEDTGLLVGDAAVRLVDRVCVGVGKYDQNFSCGLRHLAKEPMDGCMRRVECREWS